jgi:nitroimidazol reductase NimA-like FMN-containing flavoprotein (pyridoxamine 5'-phosphate oxidase superfamily)
MTTLPRTPQSRVGRLPDRGHYDRETIYPIVDEAPVCHVAFVEDGQPYVIPTLHARDGDAILLHGSVGSRLLRHLAAGNPASLAFTLVDGMVLARSVFHHSVNYRSAVVFGRGARVEGEAERLRALERLTERLAPGRWSEARLPNARELAATAVVRVAIEAASAKVRSGPPKDDEEDLALPVWAGVLPVALEFGEPVPDPSLRAGIAPPTGLRERFRGGR